MAVISSSRLLGIAGIIVWTVSCGHGTNSTAPPAPPAPALSAEDIERSPATTIEQLLMARVPGLYVTRAGDGTLVARLRGPTTLTGDLEPLFVLDGIPLAQNGLGNLSAVSPRDIASIDVLKDPTSTAMYGARGANGVIVIRTKSPP
jgi:TonB-dependent SusC/RagA subfamily outer membrane receptor